MKYAVILFLTLAVGCATIDPHSTSTTAKVVCNQDEIAHYDTPFSYLKMVCREDGWWLAFALPLK